MANTKKESKKVQKKTLNDSEFNTTVELSERVDELIAERKALDKNDEKYEEKLKAKNAEISSAIADRERHEKTCAERKKHKRNIVMQVIKACIGLVIAIVTIFVPVLKSVLPNVKMGNPINDRDTY